MASLNQYDYSVYYDSSVSANVHQDYRKGRKQPEWKGKDSRRIISSKTNLFSSPGHLHCSWEHLPWWETDIWQKRSQTDRQGKKTSKQFF